MTYRIMLVASLAFGCAADFSNAPGTHEEAGAAGIAAGAAGSDAGASGSSDAGTAGVVTTGGSSGKGGSAGSSGHAGAGGGAGTSATGGSAGSATSGGSAGTGGSSGSSGAAGGGASGSAGTGGASGSAGTGGASGSAGSPTAPTCSPKEAIYSSLLPDSFVWGGFSKQGYTGTEQSCAKSDGGTVTIASKEIDLSTKGNMGSLYIVPDASYLGVQVLCGQCGAELPTGDLHTGLISADFTYEPSGNGYVTHAIHTPHNISATSAGCDSSALNDSSGEIDDTGLPVTLEAAAAALIDGKVWMCK